MTESNKTGRRRFMAAAGGAALTVSLAGCTGGDDGDDGADGDDADPEPDVDYLDEEPDYDGYLDDANLYDGQTVDMTGEDEVVVLNGADDGLAYEPAAVAVDPGTTVVWEWTGEGGAHNVEERDGEWSSGSAEDGDDITWDREFDEGTHLYKCTPHEGVGMKGAVHVVE